LDTTKDIVDAHQNEEENNNDVVVATTEQPNVNNTNTTNTNSSITTPSGLQQIEDDNDDLPLPMGMAEVISNRAEPPKQIYKVEQIDNNEGPEPPTAMVEESLNAADPEIASKTTAAISDNLSSVNELTPPVPFDSAEYEDDKDTIAKKKRKVKDEMNQTAVSVLPPSDRDSIYEPPREVIEGENELQTPINRRGWIL